jgi:hypothetical protein
MSLRQVRKLKEAQQASASPEQEPIEEEVGSDEEVVPKKSVFSKVFLESSSSSSESEIGEPSKSEGTIALMGPMKRVVERSKKSKKQPSSPAKPSDMIKSVLDPSLKLDISKLNPQSELRRIFGGQKRSATSAKPRVIKRKHWLVEPEKDWPLVVKDAFRMEECSDGTFRLVPESEYETKLKTLCRIVITHDVEALYHFVQFNPFHPHGLIQLATILIEQRSEFENAYSLIRRALFAFQSAFLPSFHPNESLILSTDSIFSSSLLRCLLLYSHLLAGQGCVRTSLEIMKLIYAMEGGMLVGCPRSHILPHIDVGGFRCDQYEWLSGFLTQNGLVDVLPSSSLLFAVSQYMKGIDSEKTMSKSDLLKRPTTDTFATVALVRTILMFPGIVKLVHGKEIPGVTRTTDVLINKFIQAFSIKGLSQIKSNEKVVGWISGVIETILPQIVKTSGISSLASSKPGWLETSYSNLVAAEFEWGKSASGSFIEPSLLIESETQVLEIYTEEGFTRPTTQTSAPTLSHAVSLDSNPLFAFFETLLPWSRVDATGTESNPITARGLLEQLQSSLGITRMDQNHPLIQDNDNADGEGEADGEGSDTEEEIDME